MSRWIEIDTALLKTVTAGRLSAKALWKRIMKQPSIDIVRCDECRHWSYEESCDVFNKPMCFDDFCSYGEREGE